MIDSNEMIDAAGCLLVSLTRSLRSRPAESGNEMLLSLHLVWVLDRCAEMWCQLDTGTGGGGGKLNSCSLISCDDTEQLSRAEMMSQMDIPEEIRAKLMEQLGVSSQHIDEALG